MDIEVTGLRELIKQCEEIATPRELETTDKLALKKCSNLAEKEVEKLIPVSKDVSKSGRKGSRTFQHAKDNVPIKIKNVGGKMMAIIGWEKSDNSPYFYMKFIEFGTSKMPPQAPFKKVFIKQRGKWDEIFIEEYEKLVEKLNR